MKIPFTNYDLSFDKITNIDKSQPQSSRVTTRIINRQLYRVKQDIGNLRTAIQTAESEILPDRAELIRTYRDVVIDAHLSSVWETMRQKVQTFEFVLTDENGEIDEEATKRIQKPWFNETIKHVIDSKLWGHSLIQFGPIKDDAFTEVKLVRRDYVTPELKIVKKELHAAGTGTNYTTSPYKNWILEVGDDRDLGLLMKASFWALWKKNIIGAWSEFAEIFGMPTRIGRTDINDPELLKNMDKMLKEMGSAAYGVFDNDDQIEFLETARTDTFKVYDEFIKRANSEISKLIVGQTMTSDDGSSLSQAQVHENVFEMRAVFMANFVSDVVNMKLIPLMQFHGMIKPGVVCKVSEGDKVTEMQKREFVLGLLQYYSVPPEWINENFDIPVEAGAALPVPGEGNFSEVNNKLSTIMNDVNRLYNEAYEHAHKHNH